ncbi:MAG: peptidylprolyl isomerase [Deferrisomatales bacterium]
MKNPKQQWKWWTAAAAVAAVAAAGWWHFAAKEPSAPAAKRWEAGEPVLRFTDEVVTYGEVAEIWRAAVGGSRSFDAATDEERQRFVNNLGTTLLMGKEARARGLDQGPAFRQRFLPWAYERLYPLYVQKEITEKVNPTDEELLQHVPMALPSVQVRVVLKFEKADADKIYQRAQGGEDFEALAMAESEGRLRDKGGLTEWLDVHSKAMFPPPVVQRFLDAEVGQVLPPFYQDIGFLVVKVVGKRSAEEVRGLGLETLRDSLLLGMRREAYEGRIAALRASGLVEVFDQALDRIVDGSAGPDETVMRVGERKFSAADLMAGVLMGQHSGQVAHQKLTNFADKALLGEEAMRLGLDQDPGYRAEARFAEAEALTRILAEAVGEQAAATPATEEEVRAYYDATPAEFTVPEQRDLRLIELRSEAEAGEALAELAAGKPFDEVARARSRHEESREKGGEIGAFTAEALPDPVRGPVFALGVGEYTREAVVGDTPQGKVWMVLQVTAVRKAAVVPFERVRTHIVEGRIQTWKRAKALSDLKKTIEERFGYKNCLESPC